MAYEVIDAYFPPSGIPQEADRIIVHRQGNPGAKAINAIEWGKRTGAFTVHEYIEDNTVYHCQHWDQHAFHVKEARVTAQRGYVTNGPAGVRGDYGSIGIETVDIDLGGGRIGVSPETYRTLTERLADMCRITDLPVSAISGHQDWDPWTRPDDPGQAIDLDRLRADVQALLTPAPQVDPRLVQARDLLTAIIEGK